MTKSLLMIEKPPTQGIDGSAVEEMRVARGLTQEMLAQKANVSLSTVQRAEGGDPRITYRSARKLAAALAIPVSGIYPEAGSIGEAIRQIRDDHADAADASDDTAMPGWFSAWAISNDQRIEQQATTLRNIESKIDALLLRGDADV